ncbi:MAG: hypothetical protein ACOX9B_00530 [Candidatus Xenobium sp.]|nr:hypothetical protein [Burkholderiales bacterium]
MRSEERSVVGNYMSTADGPLPPTPWCGWGLKNASTAECHARRRIQGT